MSSERYVMVAGKNHRRKGRLTTCLNCEKEFAAWLHNKGMYCSRICRANGKYKEQRAKEFIEIIGDVACFNTHKGDKILVDLCDIELLKKYRYRAISPGKGTCYAVRNIKREVFATLHRDIMKPSADEMIDHANGNGLDNRRSNLRVATHSQNMLNRAHRGANKYRGVKAGVNSSSVRIRIPNKFSIHLGTFHNEELAAKIYDIHSILIHKEFGRRNFELSPEEQSELWEYYSYTYPERYKETRINHE